MKLKNPELWAECRANNTDPYGKAGVDFAEAWANRMEVLIAEGQPLESIAKKASHEADIDGITGFMYGCAIGILSAAWEHGEALRRWHNKDTQIGTEGDRANESGGVLNPALLSIGDA